MRSRTLQKWVRNYKTLCTYNPIIEDLKQYDLDLNMSSSVDEMQDFTEMSEQLKDNLYKPIIEDWQQKKVQTIKFLSMYWNINWNIALPGWEFSTYIPLERTLKKTTGI